MIDFFLNCGCRTELNWEGYLGSHAIEIVFDFLLKGLDFCFDGLNVGPCWTQVWIVENDC